MVNYEDAKIYKIICHKTGLIYVGSTCCSLKIRLARHKSSYKRYIKGKDHFVTSFKLIENGIFEIVLIQNYPCETKKELHKQERFFIESMVCVNKYIPCRTSKEYREDIKVFQKTQGAEFVAEIKEIRAEKDFQYRRLNSTIIKEKRRIYEYKNRAKIDAKNKLCVENYCKMHNIKL